MNEPKEAPMGLYTKLDALPDLEAEGFVKATRPITGKRTICVKIARMILSWGYRVSYLWERAYIGTTWTEGGEPVYHFKKVTFYVQDEGMNMWRTLCECCNPCAELPTTVLLVPIALFNERSSADDRDPQSLPAEC